MDLQNTKVKKTAALATETVTTIAVLTALSIVCSMFLTIRGGTFMKFSPVFIVIALAARRYGVFGAAIVAFLSDLIQYLMFPAFNFSIGICLSGVVSGVIFGLFFYEKINLTRIIIASALSQIICTVGITTFTMVYIERWYPTLESIVYWRILQAAIMFVASVVFLYLLFIKIDIAKLTKVVK